MEYRQLEQYRQVVNGLALHQLDKVILIPDIRCGVGAGEETGPLGLTLQYPTKQKPIVVAKPLSIEETTVDQQGHVQLDFPKYGWLGYTIGGV
jgi:hypothetical protein